MFGPHLMLDCFGCDEKKLGDVGFIFKLLDELPNKLKMRKMIPPYVFFWPGVEKPGAEGVGHDIGGVSGIVLIAESHISIHTFLGHGYATIDVFSCKDFDTDFATDYLVKALGAKRYEKHLVSRGSEYPKDIMKARTRMDVQRMKH